VLCLRESAEITLIDGEIRRGQKVRGYSWVVTANSALAATKAHLEQLRALCLDPPEPPFAIVLTDSGQTHQLYRGTVNHSREVVTVTLEAEPVTYRAGQRVFYRPDELAPRLDLCGRLIAATGKPALREPITQRFALAVMERYCDGEALLNLWTRVREQPLSRLAAWISPAKETCLNVYPSDFAPRERFDPAPAATDDRHGRAPARDGRVCQPASGRRGGNRRRNGDDPESQQRSLFGDGQALR
jgi:hypothetical protein